jgi:molecular chaperone HscA
VQARLAVDLGSSNTVAVVQRHGESARSLLFDGSPILPSGVYADVDGTLHVGRDAQRMALVDPSRYEPYPKRRVDDVTALLGDIEMPVVNLFAAVLHRVATEARQAGVPQADATVLSCPADWGRQRRSVLCEAAKQAGLGQVGLIDEPVAAATYCLAVERAAVPDGRLLAVFDFGGGTMDVALVRREGLGWRVLVSGGLDDLGGLDVDAALAGHVGHLLEMRDKEAWRRLNRPATAAEMRDRLTFWDEVRAAKEMLARAAVAPIQVPRTDSTLHLTREELDRIADPLVARAVDETRRVVQRAGVDPAALAAIMLVGGSSRLPLVASRLHARFGIAPTVPEQPELPVAHGALLAAPAIPGPAGSPAGPPPGPVAPIPAMAPGAPAPPPVRPVPSAPPRPVPPPRRRGPFRRLLPLVVILTVLALGCGGVFYGFKAVRDFAAEAIPGVDNPFGGGGGDDGELKVVASYDAPAQASAVAGVATSTAGYYAVSDAEKTQVVGQPVGGGKKWSATLQMYPTKIKLKPVGDFLVVDGEQSANHGGKAVRAVLDTKSHKKLWEQVWEERQDVGYLGDDVVVESTDIIPDEGLRRVSLRTGKTLWTRPPRSGATIDTHLAAVALSWPTEKAKAGPVVTDGFRENLHVGTDIVELDDEGSAAVLAGGGKTAKVSKGPGAVPVELDAWTAYEGLVIGAQESDGRNAVTAWRLSDLSQAWTYKVPPGTSIERVRPCGPQLVCAVLSPTGGNDTTTAIRTGNGKAAWPEPVPAPGTEQDMYVTPKGLLYGERSGVNLGGPVLISWEGRQSAAVPGGNSRTGESSAASASAGTVYGLDKDRTALVSTAVSAANGGTVEWQVSCATLGGDRETPAVSLGSSSGDNNNSVETVSIAGDTVVTATTAKSIRVLRIEGLTG